MWRIACPARTVVAHHIERIVHPTTGEYVVTVKQVGATEASESGTFELADLPTGPGRLTATWTSAPDTHSFAVASVEVVAARDDKPTILECRNGASLQLRAVLVGDDGQERSPETVLQSALATVQLIITEDGPVGERIDTLLEVELGKSNIVRGLKPGKCTLSWDAGSTWPALQSGWRLSQGKKSLDIDVPAPDTVLLKFGAQRVVGVRLAVTGVSVGNEGKPLPRSFRHREGRRSASG